MKNRFTWLMALLAPDNPYHRHGAEMTARRPRMEQPEQRAPHGPDIDLDTALPMPAHPGGRVAYRIALPRHGV